MQKINQKAEYEVIKNKLRKNQKDWIEYFNNPKLVKSKVKMISAADIYLATKEADEKLLASLRNDINRSWIVTSTQIKYKENLETEITHDKDSKVVAQKTINAKVPVYPGTKLTENEETEKYMQALFDTKDSLKEIITTLNKLGENKPIYLWTPSQSYRNDNPIRAVWLFFVDSDFVVSGNDWVGGGSGLSRGVRVSSAKQNEAKKC